MERGISDGVCGHASKGLDGTNMVGDDSHDDEGWRGQLGGCGHGFRYGGQFGGEL
jgi:hypothetical protein